MVLYITVILQFSFILMFLLTCLMVKVAFLVVQEEGNNYDEADIDSAFSTWMVGMF